MRRVVLAPQNGLPASIVGDGETPTSFYAESAASPLIPVHPVPAEVGSQAVLVTELWALPANPSGVGTSSTDGAQSMAVSVPAGSTRWAMTEMGPDRVFPMHETPTIDYGFIVAGSAVLAAEDGSSTVVHAGDAVIIDGKHSWHAGKAGCRMVTLQVGLGPR